MKAKYTQPMQLGMTYIFFLLSFLSVGFKSKLGNALFSLSPLLHTKKKMLILRQNSLPAQELFEIEQVSLASNRRVCVMRKGGGCIGRLDTFVSHATSTHTPPTSPPAYYSSPTITELPFDMSN